MKRLPAYAIVVLVIVAVVAIAQERFDYKVRNYFFSGFAGDHAALQKGMKICEDALAADPKNAEALVWHGAGVYFEASQAFQQGDRQKGTELAQLGAKEMDDAVAMAPDDVGVRIPRGAVMLTSSRFVTNQAIARGMIEKGISDMERAYAIQESSLAKMGTHPKGELFIALADGYSRLGQQDKAEEWFKRIATEMKGTPYGASANLWLQTKSLPPEKAGCFGCHTGN
jgi:tetratricopeptide (TPR) repeat protein